MDRRGTTIIFKPPMLKTELDSGCTDNICFKLEEFIVKEGLYDSMLDESTSWIRTKYKDGFQRGPFLICRRDPDERLCSTRISFGPNNYMEFVTGLDDFTTDITDHSFNNPSYTSQNVEEWFGNVLKSIEVAKERDCFEWQDQSTYIPQE